MADMLVKLYTLPAIEEGGLKAHGITIRRPYPSEKSLVLSWIADNFTKGWADECEVAFSNQPLSTFIAVKDGAVLGFACHDAACRNFFGPTGVSETARGKGVGKALLLYTLHAMREQGYAYGIIGGVGPADFYSKVAGAVMIQGSTPGIYKDLLSRPGKSG